jgi:hypothetical protein
MSGRDQKSKARIKTTPFRGANVERGQGIRLPGCTNELEVRGTLTGEVVHAVGSEMVQMAPDKTHPSLSSKPGSLCSVPFWVNTHPTVLHSENESRVLPALHPSETALVLPCNFCLFRKRLSALRHRVEVTAPPPGPTAEEPSPTRSLPEQ